MLYDGTAWVDLGLPDISPSDAFQVCLASDANGNIYVGYTDNSTFPTAGKMTVKRMCMPPYVYGLPGTSCSCNITLEANFMGAVSYQWYNSGTAISGATSSTYNVPGAGGTYTVSATNSIGCTSTSTEPQVVGPLTVPTPAISPTGSASFSGNALTVNPANPAYGYQWYNGSTPVSQPWTNVGNADFSVEDVGNMSLALYSVNGTTVPVVAYGYNGETSSYITAEQCTSSTSSWTAIGSPLATTATTFVSLAVSSSGTPYVAYVDLSEQANVLTPSGGGWTALGGADFTRTFMPSGSYVGYNSLAINSSGVPYFAFCWTNEELDGSPGGLVLKYNSGSWTSIGSGLVPTNTNPAFIDLALNSSSVPYVVYVSGFGEGGANSVTVMKNTGSWAPVGSANFSAYGAAYTSIALSSCGTPYVAFSDGAGFGGSGSGKLSVMMYTGTGTTGWQYVGSQAFSTGQVYGTSIAIDPSSGIPFVSYYDAVTGTNVVWFNGTSWVNLGASGFANNGVWPGLPLALDANGNAYIAYSDGANGYEANVLINNQQTYTPTSSGSYTVEAYNSGNGCSSTPSTSAATAVTVQTSVYISSALEPSYPAGGSITINYIAVGSYTAGNIFTAQLSDASGSFNSPSTIGSVTSTTSGTISATIPTSVPDGSNYQIRIVSSTPSTSGPASSAITICASCRMALSFSSGDRVKVANNSAYNFGTGNFTLEAWVNLPSSETYTNPSIVSNRSSGTNGLLFAFASYNNTDNDLNAFVLQINGTNYYSDLFNNIDDNTCHHVAVTRASGAITFYLDGVAVGTATSTASLSSTYPLFIGFDTVDGGSDSYLGTLDDIRIWNIAESAATIAANMTVIVPGNSSGLVGYWDFNEPSGNIVYDQSSTANNGSFETSAPSRVTGKCFIPTLESGLVFNGANGGTRATVPNNSNYNFGSGTFTLEAWVNTSSQSGTAPGIASTRTSTGNGFLFSTLSGNDLLLQMGGTNYYSHGFTNIEGTGCNHIAVASTGAGALQFYLNGSALGGTIPCSTSVSSTGNLYIGYDEVNTNVLNGNINEFRIWNTTRTAAQIADNMTTVFPAGTSNLVGYWRFNEIGDQTIYDQSSTANNGYLGTSPNNYTSYNPTRTSTACYSGDRLSDSQETVHYTPIDSSNFTTTNTVKIYPNPSPGVVNIQISATTQPTDLTIVIYNSVGQQVYSNNAPTGGNKPFKADLSNQPAGLYVVQVTVSGEAISQKVIIE